MLFRVEKYRGQISLPAEIAPSSLPSHYHYPSSSPVAAESDPLLMVHVHAAAAGDEHGQDGAVPAREIKEERKEPVGSRGAEKQRKKSDSGGGGGLLDRVQWGRNRKRQHQGTKREFHSASYRDMVRKGWAKSSVLCKWVANFFFFC